MLYLKKIAKKEIHKVEIDYYVPFTINVKKESLILEQKCWRIGNFKNSLIEVSIDKNNGLLQEIALISANKVNSIDKEIEKFKAVEYGIPVFEIKGNMKNDFCDEQMDFNVYLNKKFIQIKFGDTESNCKFIKSNRVYWGINNENIFSSLIIKDLTEQEYKDLKESFKLET